MVDNVNITQGSGAVVAADDIGGGILAQRVKIVLGADGVGVDASPGAGVIDTGTARVTLATDDSVHVKLGALTETAPANDTASSGLNGRMQRLAQRMSTLIGLVPAALGQAAKAASLAVTIASDDDLQGKLGALTETAPANDTASAGLNGRAQRIAQRLTTLLAVFPTTIDVNSGNKSASTLRVVLATDQPPLTSKLLVTPDSVAVAAGENHVGEVGGNEITVAVTQTVTSASAYATGNAIGGLMTIANAARVSGAIGTAGTSGLLQSVVVQSKSNQSGAIDIFLFNATPSGSTVTDKTAFVLAAADVSKVVAVVHVTDWTPGNTSSVGQATQLALPFALASATSLFAAAVTRSTPTFASTSDIAIAFGFLRN